jgi:hypothetical protein
MSESTLRVRAAQPADIMALNELVTVTLGESLGTVLPDEELSACAREYRAHPVDETCYVADMGSGLAGYAVLATQGLSCGPVRRLYVRHDLAPDQEREVVTALVTALCNDREQPIPVIKERQNAIALYDRWGFVDMSAVTRCLSLPWGHGRLTALATQ